MPAKRLSMRKLKEVLRLRFDHKFTNRAISRTCSISPTTVAEYINRFERSGLKWPLSEDLDDISLQRKLFPEPPPAKPPEKRQMPDMKYLHQDNQRCTALVTSANGISLGKTNYINI